MTDNNATQLPSRLSWRIPDGDDPAIWFTRVLRTGALLILLVVMLIFFTPSGKAELPLLLGVTTLCFAGTVYFLYRWRQATTAPENVWFDATGFHWIDALEKPHHWPLEVIAGYAISPVERNEFPHAAIVLHRIDGYRSQPIQIRAPVEAPLAERWFDQHWNVRALPLDEPLQSGPYDTSLDLYFECDEDFNSWHFAGNDDSFGQLADQIDEAAATIEPPPFGARPKRLVLLLSRRDPIRFAIAVDHHVRISHDFLVAPAKFLRELAENIRSQRYPAGQEEFDASFPLEIGPREKWTVHLHWRDAVATSTK